MELRESIKKAENIIDFDKESSPIYDIIQDINRDTQIILFSEKQSQKNNEDTSVLKYIFEKLDNMEESIQLLRNESRENYNSGFPRKVIYAVNYESVSEQPSINNIYIEFQEVTKIEPNIEVVDVHVEKNRVLIFAVLKDRIAIPDVFNFFINKLEKLGFCGVKMVRRYR